MDNNKKNFDKKKQSSNNNDEFQWKKASKTGLIWILILLAALAFSTLWPDNRPNEVEVPYNEYVRLLRNKMIQGGEVTLKDNKFRGVLVEPMPVKSVKGGTRNAGVRTRRCRRRG